MARKTSEVKNAEKPTKTIVPDRCIVRVELTALENEPTLGQFKERKEFMEAHDAWEQKRLDACPIAAKVQKKIKKAGGTMEDNSFRLGLFLVSGLSVEKTTAALAGISGVTVYPDIQYSLA